MIPYLFFQTDHTKMNKGEQFCSHDAESRRVQSFLQIVAQEADDMVGLDDANHAALRVNHG